MSIDRLQAKIRKTKNPSMIGLDPTMALIPPQILQQACQAHGDTVQALAAAYETFCEAILTQLHGLVPAIKLQACCFEALGSEGVAVMQRLMRKADSMGYYVVLDCNYGSVGHISELYSAAVFGSVELNGTAISPYVCDGITVSGYLGSDGVKPFLPYCKRDGKNLFLYVKTSNKSSREVQDLISGDRVIFTAMADLAMRWSVDLFGKNGYSEIAAVVGAPFPQTLKLLREKYDRLFLMVPGYGAQGGTARNVQYAFDKFGHGAVICASRSVIGAWQKEPEDAENFAQRARQAAEKMRDDICKFVQVI